MLIMDDIRPPSHGDPRMHPMIQIADSALDRIAQIDSLGWAAGLVGGAIAAWTPDAFFYFFLILLAFNFADWQLGRRVARSTGVYSKTDSKNGMIGKLAVIFLLLGVRSLEAVLPTMGMPSTAGIGGSVFAVALLLDEMESVEKHILWFRDGRPIPGLSAIITRLRALTGASRRSVARDSETEDEST
jgi:hypothetical protein